MCACVRVCVCACLYMCMFVCVVYMCSFPSPAVAMVAFTNSSVAVVEGGSVCVCVQLSLAPASSLARDVVVKFTNQDVTTGGNVQEL